MRPLLADAINIPFVLGIGIVVLVPLMAFEIYAEAFVLKKLWSLPYRELCRLTLSANSWSLVAGIPTKILNSYLYVVLLPQDIPGFFARYPFAAAIGSLIYFIVTVLVESVCAFRWLKRRQSQLSRKQIWIGMLLANVLTYAVLAPLYYFATRPPTQIREFTNDTHWTSHPATIIVFIAPDGSLKSIQADGSGLKTVVPIPMNDYLVSSNLNLCLFRGTNGNLYFYRRDTGRTNLVWTTNERFSMDQVAFSPSGERIAFKDGEGIHMINLATGMRINLPLNITFYSLGPSVAWSQEETKFFIGNSRKRLDKMVTIQPNGTLAASPLEDTNAPALLKCYDRVGNVRWSSGEEWGDARTADTCGDLRAWAETGLGSALRIYRQHEQIRARALSVSVSPGMLHLGGFGFREVEFLENCGECLFDANGFIYVLDINAKHLGTLTEGNRFIQLTPKNERGTPQIE